MREPVAGAIRFREASMLVDPMWFRRVRDNLEPWTYVFLVAAPIAIGVSMLLGGVAYALPLEYGLWVLVLTLVSLPLMLTAVAGAVAASAWSLFVGPWRVRRRIMLWYTLLASAVGVLLHEPDRWQVEDLGIVVGLGACAALGFLSYMGSRSQA